MSVRASKKAATYQGRATFRREEYCNDTPRGLSSNSRLESKGSSRGVQTVPMGSIPGNSGAGDWPVPILRGPRMGMVSDCLKQAPPNRTESTPPANARHNHSPFRSAAPIPAPTPLPSRTRWPSRSNPPSRIWQTCAVCRSWCTSAGVYQLEVRFEPGAEREATLRSLRDALELVKPRLPAPVGAGRLEDQTAAWFASGSGHCLGSTASATTCSSPVS